MSPDGLISRVGASGEKAHVERTKDEIKDSPELDEQNYRQPTDRDTLGGTTAAECS